MSDSIHYNTVDGQSHVLMGNYIEERALYEQSGFTRGTCKHQALDTKPRILGQHTTDTNQHFTSTSALSYTTDSVTPVTQPLPRKADLRQRQYDELAHQILAKHKQEQHERSIVEDRVNRLAEAEAKRSQTKSNVMQPVQRHNENTQPLQQQPAVTFYTQTLGKSTFEKNTTFSQPISEYRGQGLMKLA